MHMSAVRCIGMLGMSLHHLTVNVHAVREDWNVLNIIALSDRNGFYRKCTYQLCGCIVMSLCIYRDDYIALYLT